MASNTILGNLTVVLGADASAFKTAMAAARKNLKGLVEAGESMKSLGDSMSKYVSLPLAGLAGIALKTAADIQSLQKGLTAVAGSAEAADKQFASLKEVAKLPGLGLEEAIQGSINLQAAGFSAEQAEGALKGFGNALATVGKGKAELDGVTTALSQMAAKGKISAEEINQIAERVPQIRKVMQKAFGTSNTEELQKMGISATEFVEKVNFELSKLPPVTGGLKNAFENMADSSKLSLATLGDAISKAFNVEGLLNGIADALAGVSEWFTNLSPGVQKFIVIAGGVVAAIGPLLVVFGAVLTAIPSMVAGFAVLSGALAGIVGPILLIGAAVAGAVFLIIKNWDTIKAYFTSGGGSEIFNKLKQTALAAFEAIKIGIQKFVQAAMWFWETFGGAITRTAAYAWQIVSKIFKAGLGNLGAVLDLWRAVFEGDWAKVWQAVKNIAARAVNGIIEVMAMAATAIPKLLGKVLSAFKIDNAFTKGIAESVKYVENLANSLKLQTVEIYANKTALESNSKSGGKVADANNKIAESAKNAAKAVGILKSSLQSLSSKDNFNAETFEIGEIKDPKRIQDLNIPVKLELLPITGEQVTGALESSVAAFENFKQQAEALINDLISNSVTSFAESMGAAIVSGNGMQGFFDNFIMMFADFASQMGALMIKTGLGKIALDTLLAFPGGGVGLVAAGVVLAGAAGAIKAHMGKGVGAGGGGSTPTPTPTSHGGGKGYGDGRVEFEISGDKLHGVLTRREYRAQRFGG